MPQDRPAALVRGTFKSAFPNGAPAATPPPAADGATATPAPPAPAAPGLTQSSGTSTLILVADTDWLFDDYSVRRLNFLGIQSSPSFVREPDDPHLPPLPRRPAAIRRPGRTAERRRAIPGLSRTRPGRRAPRHALE